MQLALCSFSLLAHLFHPLVLLDNQYAPWYAAYNAHWREIFFTALVHSYILWLMLPIQCCAWTRSVNDRSWTCSYFGRTWTERMYFCPMNVIVNVFILVFMNGVFSQFNFVQDSARFPSSLPGENWLKHTVKPFVWLLKTILWKGQWWSRWEKSDLFV